MNRSYLFFILCAIISCNDNKEKPDKGSLIARTYSNAYFDFSMQIPEGWVIQSEEERTRLTEAGAEKLRDANAEMADRLDSVEQDVLPLLSIFKFKVNTTDEFNPSFIVMSERLPEHIHNINEPAYLAITKQQLQQTGLYQTYEQQKMPVSVGGENFYMLRVSSKQRDVVTQEFYTRIKNGRYALIIIISYINDKQKEELHSLLGQLSF
jgi:hypothetical protein